MLLSTPLPYSPISSSFLTTTSNSKTIFHTITTNNRKIYGRSLNILTCKANSSASSWMMDFDLYDLLGIDNTSDQSEIKSAYRSLQKRCHPDIAGPTGHEMAIILNEAYALLSDPTSRFLYDKEQSKISELRGYNGKPLYSVWFGSESEQRAVFVDEVKCVGCLKCALIADKTFAVESVYGRARVVAQWADSENKIQEAIDACPVDCISVVERSNLAALEFLMSKQPRGNVRVGADNAVGARMSNIFADVVKFQTKFQDSMDKTSSTQSTVEDSQREARNVAIQTIRSISNWLYWQSPNLNSEAKTNLTIFGGQKSFQPKNVDKLREAVAAKKRAVEKGNQNPTTKYIPRDDYWVPSSLGLPHAKQVHFHSEKALPKHRGSTLNKATTNNQAKFYEERKMKGKKRTLAQGLIPIVAGTIAGIIAHLQVEQGSNSSRLEQHIGGSFALEIVNSSWLPVVLVGITWYLISMYVIEVAGAFTSKLGEHNK